MSDLCWVPRAELERVRALDLPREDRVELFADLCRVNALYMIARAGSGHPGSSLSCLDLLSWLTLCELGDEDLLFSSKGHDVPALYAVLIGTGRLDEQMLHALRRLDGLPGHPDVTTPGIVTNTGSLGMGISKAKGLLEAARLRGRPGRVFVLTGDGELQEGQIWESLLSAASRRLSGLCVIVDHNKLQSDTHVSAVSDLGDLEAKLASFGWRVARCDGHDPRVFGPVLEDLARTDDGPVALIADTVKGRGVSLMEADGLAHGERYAFHSGAPSPAAYGEGLAELTGRVNGRLREAGAAEIRLERVRREPVRPPTKPQRLIDAYARALLEAGERDPDLVVLDADLAHDTGLVPFRDRFPERFFECGIAEQDMVSQAGGMALRGLRPVVHSFACFLGARACEQIYNNATEGTPVVYVGSLAGLLPAGPGHSHQGVRDISTLAAIPNMVMLQPACESEVGPALDFCLAHEAGPSYLRLVSVPCEVSYELPADHRLVPGRGVALRAGRDVALFAHGPVLLGEALRAAEALGAERGISVEVIHLPWLNRVDAEWLTGTVRRFERVFALDDHYVQGGQGDRIAAALAEMPRHPPLHRLGLRDVPPCGTSDEVLARVGLDAASIARRVARAVLER